MKLRLLVILVWKFHLIYMYSSHQVWCKFDTDASYVIGITYQTIDKTHISELLGGLQGWFALIIFFSENKGSSPMKVSEKAVWTLNTLTSPCVFSLLFPIHFLWHRKGEFDEQLRVSLESDHISYSHGVNIWFNCGSVWRIRKPITREGKGWITFS